MAVSLITWLDGSDTCEDGSVLGYGGIVLWIALSFYIFIGLYVLCETYFVPSLTLIGQKLQLSEDVCGATLMAAGSSAPELFTAIIGVFLYPTENPGPSTNCASAAFNMCVIVGLSVLCCGGAGAELRSFPFIRDAFFYGIAALSLYVFYEILTPGVIELGEAIGLVSIWFVYVIVLYFDLQFRHGIVWLGRCTHLMTENAEQMILNTPYAQLPDGDEFFEKKKYAKSQSHGKNSLLLNDNKVNINDLNKKTAMSRKGRMDNGDDYGDFASERSPLKLEISSKHENNSDYDESSFNDDSNGDNDENSDNNDDNNENENENENERRNNNSENEESNNGYETLASTKSERSERRTKGMREDLTAMIETYYHDTAVFHTKRKVKVKKQAFEVDSSNENDIEALIAGDNGDNGDNGGMKSTRSARSARSTRNDDNDNDDNENDNEADASMYYVRAELTPESASGVRVIPNFGASTLNLDGLNDDREFIDEEQMRGALQTACAKFFNFVIVPFAFMFNHSIPKVNDDSGNGKIGASFSMSIVWMALLSWLVLDLSTKIGTCLALTPDFMGLTLLALGSSVPDTFSSILVARKGQMGMAVSNALGSNVFDICVCVGLSFLLKSILISGGSISVETNLAFQSFIIALFVLLALFVGLLYWSNLVITRNHGWILLVAYLLFLVVFGFVLEEEE